jgi:transcription initiation factor TFIIIB Brf1 subunit/transcription initiation factor TFIIB
MFCKKCGENVKDGELFCNSCGTPVDSNQTEKSAEKSTTDKNKRIGMIIAGAVAAVVVILIISLFAGGGWRSTANKYFNACEKGNYKTVMKLTPDDAISAWRKEHNYSKSDFEERMEDRFELSSNIEKADCKIVKAVKYDKDELEDLAESLESRYDIDEKKVKDAVRVYYYALVIDDDGDISIAADSISVIKVGSKWYIHPYRVLDGSPL